MPKTATAKQEKIGILEKPLNGRYNVRYTLTAGPHAGTRYGTVRNYYGSKTDAPILTAAEKGCLVVDDMILPHCFEVPEVLCVDIASFDDKGMRDFEKAAYKAAVAIAEKLPPGVQVGKMFSIGVADGKAPYIVTRMAGTKCDVEWRGWHNGDRYTDHFFGWGRKNIPVSTVLKYVRQEEGMAALFRKKAPDFIESRPDGTIVHYHDGFSQYVRCEVVTGSPADWHGEEEEKPTKALKAVALVGEWKDHDLPRYGIDGKVYRGTWAENIYSGKLTYVNSSNLYESPDFSRESRKDPTKMKPIDLTLPPPTKAQNDQFMAWNAFNAAKEAMEEQPDETEAEQKARKGSFRKTKSWDHNDPVKAREEAERRLRGALEVAANYFKRAAETSK